MKEGGREGGRGVCRRTFVRLLHHMRVSVALSSYPPSDHPSASPSIVGHHRGQRILNKMKKLSAS